MADVKVSIQNNVITVDKDKVQVWKNQDKVKWQGDQEFGIRFQDGSGFPDPVITQQGGKWAGETGPFTTSGFTLKYDVTSPHAPTLDPQIQVLP